MSIDSSFSLHQSGEGTVARTTQGEVLWGLISGTLTEKELQAYKRIRIYPGCMDCLTIDCSSLTGLKWS